MLMNVSTEDFDHEHGLDDLLTELETDIAELRRRVRGDFGAKWEALDIQRTGAGFELMVRENDDMVLTGRIRYIMVERGNVLDLALSHDLLTIDAAVLAVSTPLGDEPKMREHLAAGVRTPWSKSRGFRWGADLERPLLRQLVQEDFGDLAELVADLGIYTVSSIAANHEVVSVQSWSDKLVSVPFDHFPFLGAFLVQRPLGRADADMVHMFDEIVDEVRKSFYK